MPDPAARPPPPTQATLGILYAVGAYGSWGLLPVYWKALAHVPVLEVLANRIVWSALFAALLLTVTRGWRDVRVALTNRRTLVTLLSTSLLIGVNWGLFIWAVEHGNVLASSLGYFLNPLVNVALGVAFLQERLRPLQWASVAVAAAAVAHLALAEGQLPWLSLALAGSFGLYGLLRKVAPMAPLTSLFVETAVLAPAAAALVAVFAARGESALGSGDVRTTLLLAGAGIVTGTPLLWFASAARRLRLATLGLLQYLAPTGHFLLAVFAFGEPFDRPQALAFGAIWSALALYSVDAVRAARSVPSGPRM